MQLADIPIKRNGHAADQSAVRVERGQRETKSHRVTQGPADKVINQQCGNIGQHQRDQNFIGTEENLCQRGDPCPCATSDHGDQHHAEQQQGRRHPGEAERKCPCCKGANGELTFSTDIPDICAIAKGQANTDDDQRAGLDHQIGNPVKPRQWRDEIMIKCRQRIIAKQAKDQRACHHRGQYREKRCQDNPRQRNISSGNKADHAASPSAPAPPISSPISSAVSRAAS